MVEGKKGGNGGRVERWKARKEEAQVWVVNCIRAADQRVQEAAAGRCQMAHDWHTSAEWLSSSTRLSVDSSRPAALNHGRNHYNGQINLLIFGFGHLCRSLSYTRCSSAAILSDDSSSIERHESDSRSSCSSSCTLCSINADRFTAGFGKKVGKMRATTADPCSTTLQDKSHFRPDLLAVL